MRDGDVEARGSLHFRPETHSDSGGEEVLRLVHWGRRGMVDMAVGRFDEI